MYRRRVGSRQTTFLSQRVKRSSQHSSSSKTEATAQPAGIPTRETSKQLTEKPSQPVRQQTTQPSYTALVVLYGGPPPPPACGAIHRGAQPGGTNVHGNPKNGANYEILQSQRLSSMDVFFVPSHTKSLKKSLSSARNSGCRSTSNRCFISLSSL